MKELVTVLIPVLNQELANFEKKIMDNSLAKLVRYPVIFLCAEGAKINPFFSQNQKSDIIYFPEKYFESKKEFSKLLLFTDFHEQFSWAEFIMLHHLDSWIVRDELHYWCKQGYDLLNAAPINNMPLNLSWINRLAGVSEETRISLGNSFEANGLTLLLIEPIVESLKSNKKEVYNIRNNPKLNNQDQVFWELIPNRFFPKVRKPTSIVRDYFAKNINNMQKIKPKTLPFAVTGITSQQDLELVITILSN